MLFSGIAGVAVLVLVAAYSGEWLILWSLPVFAVGAVLSVPRRIDLDADGITYYPVIPLPRKESFRWSDIGTPFEPNVSWIYRRVYRRTGGTMTILQAPILYGKPYRVMGVYRSRKLTISTQVATSPGGDPVGAEALLSLLGSYES